MYYLLAVPLLFGLAFLGLHYQRPEAKVAAMMSLEQASGQMDQLRTFVYSADLYMASAAAPSGAGSVTWATIRAAATTPGWAAAAGIPSHWKVVKAVDGAYVHCVYDMHPRAAAALNQFYPTTTIGTTTSKLVPTIVTAAEVQAAGGTVTSPEGFHVMDTAVATDAKQLALMCAS